MEEHGGESVGERVCGRALERECGRAGERESVGEGELGRESECGRERECVRESMGESKGVEERAWKKGSVG